MERLLAVLFSVMLLIATSPPPAEVEGCDYSGGICVATNVSNCLFSSCESEDKEQDSGCTMPVCCVSGPYCCLCLVPEQPEICCRPVSVQEKRVKPGEHQDFYPLEVDLAIWKPPAPSNPSNLSNLFFTSTAISTS
ncbi:MAG: hypothetical protein IT262_04170 [Saprospiraceae bacterium]|nr:hypothetical protein [Saprospiraceae bacterium]